MPFAVGKAMNCRRQNKREAKEILDWSQTCEQKKNFLMGCFGWGSKGGLLISRWGYADLSVLAGGLIV